MNERIKALMGQTLDEKFAGTWSTMDMQDLQKFAERFARLIVQECAEICMKEFDTGLLMAPQAPWIAEQIRKQFGVEE